MSVLANSRIATKITAITLVMALIAVSVALLSSFLITQTYTKYSSLLDKESPAATMLSRVNRSVNQAGYATYRNIVYDSGTPEAIEGAKTARAAIQRAIDLMDKVKQLLPAETKTLSDIEDDIQAISDLVGKTLDASDTDDNAGATVFMRQADTRIFALSPKITDFNDKLSTRVDTISDTLDAEARTFVVAVIAGTLASALVVVFASLLIASKGITGPLNRLRAVMAMLASGKLDVNIEGQARGDEVGLMAKTVQVFKDNALKARELEAEAASARATAETERGRTEAMRRQVEEDQKFVVASLAGGLDRVANGDLTCNLDQMFPDDYRQLQADFNLAVTKLKDAMAAVGGSVQGMKSQTDEIATASDDMSRRTEQQAAALEETAAALNEITLAVRKTADSAKQAATVTDLARQSAEASSQTVRQAVDAMGQIEQSSDQISKIIGVIDEIAFQTNLLALNAGVEAARAGEAGRGFAVVAQEVRGLAQRSAEAAKEIKALISTSSNQVGHGVALVARTGTALVKMAEQVGELTDLVTGIASSAKEQAVGLNEVNAAVNQMDQVTQQNAAMVEQSTAANKSLAGEADELMRLMSQFQTGTSSARRNSPAKPKARQATPSAQRSGHGGGGATARKLDIAENAEWSEF